MTVFVAFPALLPMAQYDPFINPFDSDIASAGRALGGLPGWQVIAIKWVVAAVALFVFSFLFGKRLRFRGMVPLLTAALIIAPLFILVGPTMKLLSLSIGGRLGHLGLALLTSTALYSIGIVVCGYVVPDFEVEQIAVAVAVAALMSLTSWGISMLLGGGGVSLMAAPLVLAPAWGAARPPACRRIRPPS